MRRLSRTFVAASITLAGLVLPIGGAMADTTSQGCTLAVRGLDGTYTGTESTCTLTADVVSGSPDGFTAHLTGDGWRPLGLTVDFFQCGEEQCSDALAQADIQPDGSISPTDLTLSRSFTYHDANDDVQTSACAPELCELFAVVSTPDDSMIQYTVLPITFQAPVVSVTPSEVIVFGTQGVETTSAPQTITMTNTGDAPRSRRRRPGTGWPTWLPTTTPRSAGVRSTSRAPG
jgi:hypothetical protein